MSISFGGSEPGGVGNGMEWSGVGTAKSKSGCSKDFIMSAGASVIWRATMSSKRRAQSVPASGRFHSMRREVMHDFATRDDHDAAFAQRTLLRTEFGRRMVEPACEGLFLLGYSSVCRTTSSSQSKAAS